ncbi:CDP-glycerol glycerophosphotransferase [Glycomyces paridis]|uniref:CDP-glycerol glycerophosphotransferase n=1 Tax=Glycomyces paridis TaxID=2126555 RepID=UPI00130541F9|nr:CDP-glycerol glycerophosphotransferase [Glycomyces paridis]
MRRLLRSETIRLTALAAAAVAAAVALPGAAWAAYALALAVFAAVARRHPGSIAALRVPRVLAALAVLIAVWASGGTERWPLLAAGALLACHLACADLAARAVGIGRLDTVNLEVHRSRTRRLAAPATVGALVNALSVAFPLAAAAPAPVAAATDPLFLALAVAVLGWAGAVAAAGQWRLRTDPHPVDAAVAAAVAAVRPKFVVHFAGTRHSEYQLRMWLPYFAAVGDPYLIIVRERHLVGGVAAETDAPIVRVPAQSVLDRLLPESVGACFYVNHAVKNAQLVKLDGYRHVQLMHGDSDKPISRSQVSLMYDRVFVAGQAGVDRYRAHGVDIPSYKFRRIGRPQLHEIRVGPRDRAPGEPPTVLYAPTWAGLTSDVDYSSLAAGRRIVEGLLGRGARVVFRAHPYTAGNRAYRAFAEEIRALLAADAAATGRDHWWGARAEKEATLTDCVNAADAAVCDVSGTASDWLYGGRPLAMTDPRGLGDAYAAQFPLARAAYRVDADAGNLEAVLDELLGADSLAPVRAEVREYYLGDLAPGDLVEVFRQAVRSTYRPVWSHARERAPEALARR